MKDMKGRIGEMRYESKITEATLIERRYRGDVT